MQSVLSSHFYHSHRCCDGHAASLFTGSGPVRSCQAHNLRLRMTTSQSLPSSRAATRPAATSNHMALHVRGQRSANTIWLVRAVSESHFIFFRKPFQNAARVRRIREDEGGQGDLPHAGVHGGALDVWRSARRACAARRGEGKEGVHTQAERVY